MSGQARRWPSRREVAVGALLSRPGVERAAVRAVAALKFMNITQALLVLYFARDAPSRLWLAVAAVAALAVSGAVVVWTGWRAQRLVRPAVAVDVAVAVAVLAGAPWFQPAEPGRLWLDWPISATFLVGAEAAVCFSLLPAAVSTLALVAAVGSWLLASSPPATRDTVVGSFVPYIGFAIVTGTFLYYLRQLAELADSRAATIQNLEAERTRRVLHTPYRLLNDLAEMLRQEAVRDGEDAHRQARLAEAVASVHEIESLVRGTEPASSNLSTDLLGLRDQFVDLPLLMNVQDASVSLPPGDVYRIREAVRSALQNARLHAGAGEVVVYATTDEASWLVSVHDDGSGFDPDGQRRVGIRELMVGALAEIGATVNIESAPGQGTLVEFRGDLRGGSGTTTGRGDRRPSRHQDGP